MVKRQNRNRSKSIPQEKWLRNVLKSIGHSSSDMLTHLMPTTTDMIKNNSETVTDMIRDMRDMRSSNKRLMKSFESSDYMKAARDTYKNLKSDLKSGKFYNKERSDRIMDESMNAELGLGDDFEFDMSDDDSFDISMGDEEGGSPTVVVNSNINGDNPMVQATIAQTKAIIDTSEAAQKSQLAIANQAMVMDKRMLDLVSDGVEAINSNLATLVEFNSTNMTKYTAAALQYYQDSMTEFKSINEHLKYIRENGLPVGPAPDKKERPEDPYEFLFSGGFDLAEYGKIVKKQLKSTADNTMLGSMLKLVESDKTMLKFMTASPLSFISTKIAAAIIPSMLKTSFQNFDTSLKEFIPAMLMKMGSMSNNYDSPLLEYIGKIFGINPKQKTSVDLSKYTKGPIPFDGQTKYAIVNVIPTYLRKILSAVSGREEIAINWDTGVMKEVSSIKKEWDDDIRYARTSGASSIINSLHDRLETFQLRTREEQAALHKELDRFMDKYLSSTEFIDWTKTKDQFGFRSNELENIFSFSDPEVGRLILNAIRSLPKNQQTALAGSARISAREAVTQRFQRMEDGQTANNAFNLFGDKSKSSAFKLNSDGSVKTDSKGNAILNISPSVGADKYGFSPADYLRDIRTILTKGIIVFPNATGVYSSSSSTDMPSHVSKFIAKEDREDKDYARKISSELTQRSDAELEYRVKDTHSVAIENTASIMDYSDEQLVAMMENKDRADAADEAASGDATRSRLGKKWADIKNKIARIYKLPAEAISKILNTADNAMYRMVFTGDGGGKGFLLESIERIGDKLMVGFNNMSTFMNEKFFSPIKKFLFEGPDSLKAKWDDSDLKKSLKNGWEKAKDWLFGVKMDGTRQDGLFSGIYQNLQNMGFEMRNYITGAAWTDPVTGETHEKNEDSVFSHFGNFFKSWGSHLKKYFFGDKEGTDAKSVFGEGVSRIRQGFQSWADAIFGTHRDEDGNEKSNFMVNEFAANMKKAAPKAFAFGIAGAGLGLINGIGGGFLPSLFLPGGPIGGAILGTTLGFLSQSEGFKNWLFGEEVDGERMGGLISKKTQDFFKKHKTAMIGGATLGTVKSMLGIGILPSLVGGPIGGAALGVATSLITRSDAFKKLMFGGEDADGNEVKGILSKITDKFKDKDGNNTFGKIGAGAIGGATLGLIASKFGLMGSLFLGGGPLIGALVGTAGGIALTSEKWKKALFGEWDADEQIRKGGVFGKFINWTNLQIFQPLKLKFEKINLSIREWFESSIANPFKEALAPIKFEFEKMVENMKGMFKAGWDNFTKFLGGTFEKYVGQPFGKVMEEKVLKPLKGFFNSIIRGAGAIIGNVLAAPFKGINAFSRGLQRKHEEQGLRDRQREGLEVLLDGKKAKEKGISGWDRIKYWYNGYFNQETREAAMAEGAPYASQLEEYRKELAEKTKAKYSKEWDKISDKERALEMKQDAAKVLNYADYYYDKDGKLVKTGFGDVRSPEDIAATIAAQQRAAQNAPTNIPSSANATIADPRQAQLLLPAPGVYGGGQLLLPAPSNMSQLALPMPQAGSTLGVPVGAPYTPNSSLVPLLDPNARPVNRGTASTLVPLLDPNAGPRRNTSSTLVPLLDNNAGPRNKGESATKVELGSDTTSAGVNNPILNQIATDVRKIASEINGQLDGVGSNVYKIRKMLQDQSGMEDGDITGSANRGRKGLLGKIKSFMYKPIEKMTQLISKPFVAIFKFVNKVKTKVFKGVKWLITAPFKVAKELYGGVKALGKALLGLPVEMAKMVGTGVAMLGDVVKAFAPALGQVLLGVGSVFKETLHGVGLGLKEVAHSAGKVMAAAGMGLAKTIKALGGVVPTIINIANKTFQTAARGIFGLVHGAMDVVGLGFSAVMKPLMGKVLGFGRSSKVKVDTNQVFKVKIVGSEVSIPTFTSSPGSALPSLYSGGSTIGSIIDAANNGRMETDDSAATLEALRANDAIEDKEAEDAARIAEQKADIERRAEDARSETAEKRQAQLEADKKADEEEKYKAKMLEHASTTAESTKEHTFNWAAIFGSKTGLITTALIAALPFAGKIWNSVKEFLANPFQIILNLLTNEEGREDEDGNQVDNKNAKEAVIKQGIKTAAKVLTSGAVRGGVKGIKGAIKGIRNFGKGVAKVGRGIKKVGSWIGDTKLVGKNWERIVADDGSDIGIGVVRKGMYNAAEGTDDILREVGAKVKPVGLAGTKVGKFAAKVSKAIDDILMALKGILTSKLKTPKMATDVIDAVRGIFKKVITSDAAKKMQPLITKAMSVDAAKLGSVMSGILTAIPIAFSVYDGISGAYEVRRIFRLDAETEVTTGMRIASAITKIMTDFFALPAILITIGEEHTNFPIRQTIANSILAIIDKDSLSRVESGYAKFKEELATYNEAMGTQLTEAAWNDKTNKTFWEAMDPKAGMKWLGGKAMAGLNWLGGKAKAGWDGLVGGVTGLGKKGAQLYDAFKGNKWTQKFLGKGGFGVTGDDVRERLGLADDAKVTTGMRMSSLAATYLQYATPLGLFMSGDKMTRGIETARVKGVRYVEAQWEAFNNWIKSIGEDWNRLKTWTKDGVNKLKDNLSQRWSEMVDQYNNIKKGVREMASGAVKNLKQMGSNFDTFLGGMLGFSNPDGSPKKLSLVLSAKVKVAKDTAVGFLESANNVILKINKGINDVWTAISDELKKVRDTIKGWAGWLGDTVKGGWNAVVSSVTGIFTGNNGPTNTTPSSSNSTILSNDLDNRLSGASASERENIIKKFKDDYIAKGYDLATIENAINDRYLDGKYDTIRTYGRIKNASNTSSSTLVGAGRGMQYMSQNDPRWRNNAVGAGTMGDLGCGPTAMSMVASAIRPGASPAAFQDYANARGYANSQGVDGRFISDSANQLGLSTHQTIMPDSNTIARGVKGGPMILLGRSNGGTFTNAGHYVVATDGGNGKIRISDPRGSGYNKTISADKIGGAMSAWEFRGGAPTATAGVGGTSITPSISSSVNAGISQTSPNSTALMGGQGGAAVMKVVNKMISLEGTLRYSQGGGRTNPEKNGYSDCSGTCSYCYKVTLGINTGTSTLEMLKHGAKVIENTSGSKTFHQTKNFESVLVPGDLLIFGKPSDGSRHVEMYIGNGQIMGHGSGTGPKRKSLATYTHKRALNCVRRYVDDAGNALNPGDQVGTGAITNGGNGEPATMTGVMDSITSYVGKLLGHVLFGDKMDENETNATVANDMAMMGSFANTPVSETSQVGTDPTNKALVAKRKLTSFDPVTAEQLNAYMANKAKKSKNVASGRMLGQGAAFIKASRATGLDPRYLLAHAAWESGWGTSKYARERGNFYGIGAFNDNPDNAYKFGGGSVESSIMGAAQWIKQRYTDKGADSLHRMIYMQPPGPYAMNGTGANKKPSDSWIAGVAGIMAQMGGIRSGSGSASTPNTPTNTVSGEQYIQRGNIKLMGAGDGLNRVNLESSPMVGNNPDIKIYGAGPGKSNDDLLIEVISILRSIEGNTGGSKSNLEKLLDKYNSGTNVNISNTAPIVTTNKPLPSANDARKDTSYKMAKNIAKGKYA